MADTDSKKMTLLVVDDSRLMRVAARKILMNDFEVLQAADGEEGWEILQQHPEISLVMSDLSMPRLDGLGLLKRIRDSRFSDLPVIIVTGAEDDDGSKREALAAGASDFITKPFESVQLLARAKSQAAQKTTREALQESESERRKLRESSAVDPLTGLASRRAFMTHLEENLAYATRHRTELSLVALRIEKYKVLYLRRGKQAVGKLTTTLAALLGEDRRREDTVGMLAPDTFGILLPSANRPGARRVMTQLQQAVADLHVEFEGEPIEFNVRMGSCTPDIRPGIRAEDVIAALEATLREPSPAPAVTPQREPAPATDVRRVDAGTDPRPTAPANTTPQAAHQPPAANADAIHAALLALGNKAAPGTDAGSLMRGILPLIEWWNRSSDGRHTALLQTLRHALAEEPAGPGATPAETRLQPEPVE